MNFLKRNKKKEIDEVKVTIIVEKIRRLIFVLDYSFIYDIEYINCNESIYDVIETNKDYIFDHKDVILNIDHKMKDDFIGLAIKINGYYTINYDQIHNLYCDGNKIIENVLIKKSKNVKVTLDFEDQKCYESLDKDINKIIHDIADIIHEE